MDECDLCRFPASGESDVWPGVDTCPDCERLLVGHRETRTTAVIA